MTGNFTIRRYGKEELGRLYCPEVSPSRARHVLMEWINRQPQLVEQLTRYGFDKNAKIFTPLQVRLIVEALGEP